jgi:hypothetical protein
VGHLFLKRGHETKLSVYKQVRVACLRGENITDIVYKQFFKNLFLFFSSEVGAFKISSFLSSTAMYGRSIMEDSGRNDSLFSI